MEKKSLPYRTKHWYSLTLSTISVCPKEGNKNDERTRGFDLQGAAEHNWFVQLRENES